MTVAAFISSQRADHQVPVTVASGSPPSNSRSDACYDPPRRYACCSATFGTTAYLRETPHDVGRPLTWRDQSAVTARVRRRVARGVD